MRNLKRAIPPGLALVLAAGCGPAWAPPTASGTPCPTISAAQFDEAIASGAARADARFGAGGTVSMQTGPGVVHCATYTSTLKPCRRPNDFVIRYTLEDGAVTHVRVPAKAQYRFRVQARPTTCEIVAAPE